MGWLEAEAAEARRARHHHHRARYNGRDVLAVGAAYNRRLTSRSKAHREWADVEWRLKWLGLLFERRHGLEWWKTTTAGARFVALLTDQSPRSMAALTWWGDNEASSSGGPQPAASITMQKQCRPPTKQRWTRRVVRRVVRQRRQRRQLRLVVARDRPTTTPSPAAATSTRFRSAATCWRAVKLKLKLGNCWCRRRRPCRSLRFFKVGLGRGAEPVNRPDRHPSAPTGSCCAWLG